MLLLLHIFLNFSSTLKTLTVKKVAEYALVTKQNQEQNTW